MATIVPAKRVREQLIDTSFERKFVAGTELKEFALAWLDHTCLRHPDYGDEVIHSIYYDTPALQCYSEKVNGDYLKTKLRLRWYEERRRVSRPHPGPLPGGEGEDGPSAASPSGKNRQSPVVGDAFLEVKRKEGGSRGKQRVKVDVDRKWLESADLRDAGFVDLLYASAGIGELPPVGLAPSVHISYRRQRFICPVSLGGVSLDTVIRVERINGRLISGTSCATIPAVVLETKTDRRDELPWLGRLYDAGFRSRSFSKYGECVSRLIGEEA